MRNNLRKFVINYESRDDLGPEAIPVWAGVPGLILIKQIRW